MTRQHFFWTIFLVVIAFAFTQQTTLQFGNVPKELPKIDTSLTELSWQRIVKSHYDIFANKDTFRKRTGSEATRDLTVAMFGSVWGWFYSDYNGGKYHPLKNSLRQPVFYNSIVKKFYKSSTQQQALYKWVKPFYIEAFKNLPEWKKNIYRQMLEHIKKYLMEFDYNAELTLFNKKASLWEEIGPKGRRNYDFRRLEWYVFRRVHNGDLTVQQMLKWVGILQKDLASI